jgi:hypothetical protein
LFLAALAIAGCANNESSARPVVALRSAAPNYDRARELNEAGVDAYRAQHLRDAIEYFHESWRLRGEALVLLNEALCHEQLGEPEIEASLIEEYLKQPGLRPEDRTEPQRTLATLKSRPSRLTIVTTPAGALLSIDGHAQPGIATPLTTTIVAGMHTVVVKKDGFQPESHAIEASFGRAVILELDLVKAP